MRIGASGFSPFVSFGHLRIKLPAEPPAAAPRASNDGPDLARLAGFLRELRAVLAESAGRVSAARGGNRPGTVRLSSDVLALDLSTESAALRSETEINALSTSYTPFGPAWQGASTTVATLDGVYDGDQGDEQLTFRVTLAGVVGVTPVRVDVLDEGGTLVDRLTYGSGYVPGTPLTLANGVTLALTSGLASSNDQFGVTVSTSLGSAVDPTKPARATSARTSGPACR